MLCYLKPEHSEPPIPGPLTSMIFKLGDQADICSHTKLAVRVNYKFQMNLSMNAKRQANSLYNHSADY